jgi:hypothetical protein
MSVMFDGGGDIGSILIPDEFGRLSSEDCMLYSSRRKFLASAGKSILEPPVQFKTRRQARRTYLQNKDNNEEEHFLQGGGQAPFSSFINQLQKQQQAQKKKEMFQNILSHPTKRIIEGSFSEGFGRVVAGGGAAAGLIGGHHYPNHQKMRRAGKSALGVVVLETFNFDGNYDIWREETCAGVRYWVNKTTGDVTTDCPWLQKKKSLIQISNSRKRLIGTPLTPKQLAREESSRSDKGRGGRGWEAATTDGPDSSSASIRGEGEPYHDNDLDGIAFSPGTGSLVYDRAEVDELFKLLDSQPLSPTSKQCSPVVGGKVSHSPYNI